jgi:hypothetical protein
LGDGFAIDHDFEKFKKYVENKYSSIDVDEVCGNNVDNNER